MAATTAKGKSIAKAFIDPLSVPEVFADNVVMRVRDGIVHLTMCATRPSGADEHGTIIDEHAVTARIVMSVPSLVSMFQSFQQIQQKQQQPQLLPQAPKPHVH
jgi:hypothetical protein